jgi:hypothetical protein
MKKVLFVPLLALLATSCGRAEPEIDLVAYEQEVMDWRAGRLERLLAPNGFLTQVGLYWLEEGAFSIGSDSGNDIVLPATAAAWVGQIQVTGEEIRLLVNDGVEVFSDDQAISEITLPPDTSGEYVAVSHGSIAWSVIERGGKLAIRVRDYEHPWVKSFGPLPYYDIDPKWRINATFHGYDEPRVITVNTVIEGFQQNPISPGTVTFEVGGVEYELEAQASGDSLFFVFSDATDRDDTYGAGRFLYTATPDENGKLILDFNKSYSPPCTFNDFSTCPVASPRNRLPIRIEAGEKFDPDLHYSGVAAR